LDAILALALGEADLLVASVVAKCAAVGRRRLLAVASERCVLELFDCGRSDALVAASSVAGSGLNSLKPCAWFRLATPCLPLSPSGPVGASIVNWVVAGSAVERVAAAVDAGDAVETSSESVADSRAADTAAAGPGAPWKPEWLGRT